MPTRSLSLACLALLLGAACSPVELTDGGAHPGDASTPDAHAALDASPLDAGPVDAAGLPDGSAGEDAGADAAPRPVERDCFDGIDNDEDGDTDCADEDCTPIAQCVPAPPDGWSAPGVLHTGTPADTAPCAAPFESAEYLGGAGPTGEPATCSACHCGTPTDTWCVEPLPGVCQQAVGSPSCAGGCTAGWVGAPAAGGCVNSPETVGRFLYGARSSRGTCGAATGGETTLDPPTWAATARLCTTASAGGGCEAGSTCLPRLPDPTPLCTIQEGDLPCPDGYGRRQLLHDDFDERRTCSACSCAYRSGGCTAEITAYSGAGCTGSELYSAQANAASCQSSNPGSYRFGAPTIVAPRCEATGDSSQPRGCVAAQSPRTVCCAPLDDEPTCPGGGRPMVEVLDEDGSIDFCIDSVEVTNADYEAFLATAPSVAAQPGYCAWNTSFVPTNGWPSTRADWPVRWVDHCDAIAYCEANGRRLCGARGGGVLPLSQTTSADSQWFHACTNGGSTALPYGDTHSSSCPPHYPWQSPEDVGTTPCCNDASGVVSGLMTNVREWVDACSAMTGASDECAVVGPTSDFATQSACAEAAAFLPRNSTSGDVGFRCCAL